MKIQQNEIKQRKALYVSAYLIDYTSFWMAQHSSQLHRNHLLTHHNGASPFLYYALKAMYICSITPYTILNTLWPRQNGWHFPDIFKYMLLNENVWILNMIWPKWVPKGPIDNHTALVQITAWCRSGDKPLSKPLMASIGDAYMRHSTSMS